MSRARSWVLAAALSSFAAGVAVGLVAPELVDAAAGGQAWDADEQFARELTGELGLSRDQVATLRMILAAKEEEELESIKGYREVPEPLQILLSQVGRRADQRIRVILDEEQRKRFDQVLARTYGGGRWPGP